MSPTEQLLLDTIVEAAKAGKPCPSNTVLGALAGYTNPSSVSVPLTRLHGKGVIVLTRYKGGRDVFIPSLGIGTAPFEGDRVPRAAGNGRTARKPTTRAGGGRVGDPLTAYGLDLMRAQATTRRACPRCGVNSDYGCEHTATSLTVAFV